MFICRQKINFIFYSEILHLFFGHFGHAWLHTPKVILSNCRKRLWRKRLQEKNSASSNDSWSSIETVDSFISFIKWHLNFRYCTCFEQGVPWHSGNYILWIYSKRVRGMIITYNQRHLPHFSGNIAKIFKFLILDTLGMPGYVHPKWYYQLHCLSACQKNFIIHFFFEILNFKEYCTLIGWQQIWPITQEPEFCQICDWWWNINNNISFHFRLSPGKTNDKIFQWIWINI